MGKWMRIEGPKTKS